MILLTKILLTRLFAALQRREIETYSMEHDQAGAIHDSTEDGW